MKKGSIQRMDKRIPLAALAAGILGLAACETPESESQWLELGAGLAAFESLEEGDSVQLVYGPQGGWHVDLALRFGGFGPEGVALAYIARDSQTGDSLSFETQALLQGDRVRALEEGWERLGDRVVFDIASDTEVLDQDVRFEVTAQLGENSWVDFRLARVSDEDTPD